MSKKLNPEEILKLRQMADKFEVKAKNNTLLPDEVTIYEKVKAKIAEYDQEAKIAATEVIIDDKTVTSKVEPTVKEEVKLPKVEETQVDNVTSTLDIATNEKHLFHVEVISGKRHREGSEQLEDIVSIQKFQPKEFAVFSKYASTFGYKFKVLYKPE